MAVINRKVASAAGVATVATLLFSGCAAGSRLWARSGTLEPIQPFLSHHESLEFIREPLQR